MMIQVDYTTINRAHWNEVVRIHAQSSYYDLDGFRAGKIKLSPIEREEVGDVAGKTLLHLQCGFGLSTLSWARLGARAMGVDFSEQAITVARSLSEDLSLETEFICADIYDLPSIVSDTFDVVFTSYGVLCSLPDLKRWADMIATCLKQGGIFYIIEEHPFVRVFDYGASHFQMIYPYTSPEPIRMEEEGTYADRSAQLEHSVFYEWNHSLGEVISALTSAGLVVEFLHEFLSCPWPCFPNIVPPMEEGEDGLWRWKKEQWSLPLIFSLKAAKDI